MLCLIGMGTTICGASAIAGERDRDTWTSLVCTPLTVREILYGKWAGCVLGQKDAFLYQVGNKDVVRCLAECNEVLTLAGKDAAIDTGDGAGMNLMDIRKGDWAPAALAATALRHAEPELMRAAQHGVVHKNTASRKVSRLSARVKALATKA